VHKDSWGILSLDSSSIDESNQLTPNSAELPEMELRSTMSEITTMKRKDAAAAAALSSELSDEQRFLDELDRHGGRAGNITLQRALDWPEDKYWNVRNGLVDAGQLGLGKGQGGSVHRLESLPETSVAEHQAVQSTDQCTETKLYEPVAKVLRETWVKDFPSAATQKRPLVAT
jgi:hypothetical protein